MNSLKNVLWGIVLVTIGIILGLNSLNITNIDIFFRGWWTLIIIIPCLIDFLDNKNRTGNMIGLIIGILLLLASRDIINFSLVWRLAFPTILVLIGLSVIFKNTTLNKINSKIKEINKRKTTQDKEYCSCFSGQKLDFSNEKFVGCDISAIFGGVDYNLLDSEITEDVVINASAIFGAVDIVVPKGVNVKVNSTSIFGGADNKVKNKKDNQPTIYVNCTCLFGGIEIKWVLLKKLLNILPLLLQSS